MKVIIQDGKFERALRLFKKKVEEGGVLKDLREKESFIKPSVKNKLKRNAAKKRWAKYLSNNKLPDKLY